MKKCPKCGVELPDEAVFCNNCGANLSNEADDATPVEETVVEPVGNQILEDAKTTSQNTKVGLIAIIAAVAVLVLLILIIVVSSVSGGYKGAVKKYMKAFIKGDANTMIAMALPKNVLEEYLDDEFDIELKEYTEAYGAVYDALWNSLKEEGKVKVDWEIKRVEDIEDLDKLEDDSYYEDLDEFQDEYDDEYDDYNFDSKRIKQVYVVEIKYEVYVDGKKEAKGNRIMYVFKYNGKWYVETSLSYASVLYSLDDDDFEDVYDEVEDALDDLYDLY